MLTNSNQSLVKIMESWWLLIKIYPYIGPLSPFHMGEEWTLMQSGLLERRKKERKEGRLIVWATGSTCYTALLLNENAWCCPLKLEVIGHIGGKKTCIWFSLFECFLCWWHLILYIDPNLLHFKHLNFFPLLPGILGFISLCLLLYFENVRFNCCILISSDISFYKTNI